jgi:tRNA U34 5-carboxymethylaminomethyl modifying GTPase MnmE/TrmE
LSYSDNDRHIVDVLTKILKKYECKISMESAGLKLTKKCISKSDCFLCVLTKNYINSEYCYREYKIAHQLKKKIFIVMFEKVDLDKSPIGLETIGIQRCNLYKNQVSPDFTKNKEFKDLMKELKHIIKSPRNVSFDYQYKFPHYNAYFQNNSKPQPFYSHN